MAPADAMWHWFATKFPTDQFLVFAFDGVPVSLAEAIAAALDRARRIPDLTVRVQEDPFGLRFPRWVEGGIDSAQCVVHELPTPTWATCLDAVSALVHHQLDTHVAAWRLHVFASVDGVPGVAGPATVVALQITHALGDGPRTTALAAAMFGRDAVPTAITPGRPGPLIGSTSAAVRTKWELARDVEAGRVPPAKAQVRALSPNDAPSGTLVLRSLVRRKDQLTGPTLTVSALVAVSDALSGYLQARGEDTSQLTASVPTTKGGIAQSYNHIGPASIGLHADAPSRDEKVRRIVVDLMNWRRRNLHPAFDAEEAAVAAIPAPLRRLAIKLIRSDRRPTLVPAHTVVSSVDRGPMDLSFGDRPVVYTMGFPALLPISSLVHGVHSIGDTVAFTVHASTPQVDVDDYVARLDAALPR
jgi:hypothetical protein